MESLTFLNDGNGQGYGYVVYQKSLPCHELDGNELRIEGRIHDMLTVLVNGVMVHKPIQSTLGILKEFGSWAKELRYIIFVVAHEVGILTWNFSEYFEEIFPHLDDMGEKFHQRKIETNRFRKEFTILIEVGFFMKIYLTFLYKFVRKIFVQLLQRDSTFSQKLLLKYFIFPIFLQKI